ncbi:methyltransferase family protein [Phreatobacter stygius]|uniref:methyltransferase family protein n=1 Tax=Phreatobacter stygius TaxID=1940610 RepID=UPI001477161D|nr:isoprenylcysteine carboxylmethyltransferase family protein [Phreatobacter stygius]
MSEQSQSAYLERPSRFPWPSVIFIGCLAFGWGLTTLLPLHDGIVELLRIKGALCLAAGVGLSIWASATLARGQTTTLPHAAASHLVTGGPFRFTRNPTYLGQALIIAGFGALQASPWYIAASVVYLMLITRFAILPEEAHLSLRFGAQWTAYRARVRRWL